MAEPILIDTEEKLKETFGKPSTYAYGDMTLDKILSFSRDPSIWVERINNIFVFGSNLAGRHGKGAAEYALRHRGAIYGQGVGLQGYSYAIPTKDRKLKTLPLETIKIYVEQFIEFAINNPDMTFEVTKIGCGLAGYVPKDIAPMFKSAPGNVVLPKEFLPRWMT